MLPIFLVKVLANVEFSDVGVGEVGVASGEGHMGLFTDVAYYWDSHLDLFVDGLPMLIKCLHHNYDLLIN